ncbi:hypothetical protein V8E54_002777 [Elaphomyces granulatus]
MLCWLSGIHFLLIALAVLDDVLGHELKPHGPRDSWEFPNRQLLSAATLTRKLKDRSQLPANIFRNETTFDYVQSPDDAFRDNLLVATLTVKSRRPILVLEEIEDFLEDIVCHDTKMTIRFRSAETLNAFRSEIEAASSFTVVTSHDGCNSDGERVTYQANVVSVDITSAAVYMKTVRCAWSDAFLSTHVSFSPRHHSEIQRRGERFEQRQQGTNTVAPGPTTALAFPSVSYASTLSQTAITTIDKQLINTVIFPPPNPVATSISQGITVSCKNCSLGGSIEISQGSFDLSGMDDIASFFTSGSVEIIANGLFARLELGVDVNASQNVSLNMSLPPISLTAFQIPGIVAFGPVLILPLNAQIDLREEIDFSYGVEVLVPDNSTFNIDISHLSNSSISGFDKTTFQTLPLNSSTAFTSLLWSLTFRPQLLLGIVGAVGPVTGGIGGFLDLPQLSVNITQLNNVDQKCEKATSSPGIMGNFINIVPTVDLEVGVLAELEAEAYQVSTQAVLASTQYALPTACVDFDAKAGTYSAANSTSSAGKTDNGPYLRGSYVVLITIISMGLACGWM